MPARNVIKPYVENGAYHVYNRGVEKRLLFLDGMDYGVFLSYLKDYLLIKDTDNLRKRLSNPNTSYKEKDIILKLLRLNNFSDSLRLLAFCLMPNHFHFLVRQTSANTIDQFMQSLCTRYTMYFNRKYKRVGPLFQSVYKAVLVENDEQFLHLSRYIHRQALASQGETLQNQPSSYTEYVGERKSPWVHPEEILAFFSKELPRLSYASFVKEDGDSKIIMRLTLED
jgi:putative transposase